MSSSRRPPRAQARFTTMDEIHRAQKDEKRLQEHKAVIDDLLHGYPDTKSLEIYRFEKAIVFDPTIDILLAGPCVFNETPATPTGKALTKWSEPTGTPPQSLQANGFFQKAAPEQKTVEQKPKDRIIQRQIR